MNLYIINGFKSCLLDLFLFSLQSALDKLLAFNISPNFFAEKLLLMDV